MRSAKQLFCGFAVALAVIMCAAPANAASVAVFGNGQVDEYLTSLGYSTTLVTDAQLATPGFLNSFNAFFMTRDIGSFGTGLSATAAANVAAYVGSQGNVVLLNGDFTDSLPNTGDVPDARVQQIIANATAFATASGRGFIGEFNGAVSGLTSNSNGFTPIGLIPGTAGALSLGGGGSTGDLVLTAAGAASPITSGIAFPFNPNGVEFGASISGVDSALILARWGSQTGSAAIIARTGAAAPVPEVSGVYLVGTAIGAVVLLNRRRVAAADIPAKVR